MTKNIIIGSLVLVIGFLIAYAQIQTNEAERSVSNSERKIQELEAKLNLIGSSRKIKGDFAHTVLIWLKDPENKQDRDKIERGMIQLIKDSQFVQSAHLGTPAGTDRPIVDNSYTFCLIVTFEDAQRQDQYQVEPAHKQFLEEHKELWSKVLIYDSVRS